jgi:hypothetical protein
MTARRAARDRLIASSDPVSVSSLASISPIFRSVALTSLVAFKSAAVSLARSERIDSISASILWRYSCDVSRERSMPRVDDRRVVSGIVYDRG